MVINNQLKNNGSWNLSSRHHKFKEGQKRNRVELKSAKMMDKIISASDWKLSRLCIGVQ